MAAAWSYLAAKCSGVLPSLVVHALGSAPPSRSALMASAWSSWPPSAAGPGPSWSSTRWDRRRRTEAPRSPLRRLSGPPSAAWS